MTLIRAWLSILSRVSAHVPDLIQFGFVAVAVVVGLAWVFLPGRDRTLGAHWGRVWPLLALLAVFNALMVPAASLIASRGQVFFGPGELAIIPHWIVFFAIYPGAFLTALTDLAARGRLGPLARLFVLAAVLLVFGAPLTLRMRSGACGYPYEMTRILADRLPRVGAALDRFHEVHARYPTPGEGLGALHPQYLPDPGDLEDPYRLSGDRRLGYGTTDPSRGAIVTSLGADFDDDIEEAAYVPGDGASVGLPGTGADLGRPVMDGLTYGMIVVDAEGDYFLVVGEALAP